MSRNFPTRTDTHWDYEKGNLNDETKRTPSRPAAASRRRAGSLHCFAVGRVFEQENVDWLKEIVQAGHPVGNHTYDHVNVLATRPEDIQFRFQRAPWLIEGRTPAEVIRDNIRLTTAAMQARLGCRAGRLPHARRLRRRPARPARRAGDAPRAGVRLGQQPLPAAPEHPGRRRSPGPPSTTASSGRRPMAQPFVYPDGLVEVPMSPISDIGAFRTGRWRLEWFLKAVALGVAWAIEHRAVFDFLGHPSCLYVTDPEFRAIDLICDLVRKAGRRRPSWAWTPWRNGRDRARARLVRGFEGSAARGLRSLSGLPALMARAGLDDVLAGGGDDGEKLVGLLAGHVVLLEDCVRSPAERVELRVGDGHALMHRFHFPPPGSRMNGVKPKWRYLTPSALSLAIASALQTPWHRGGVRDPSGQVVQYPRRSFPQTGT